MWPNQRVEEMPASCAWMQDRLLGYLDGDLAPRETQRLRAHLDGCPACQRELALCRRSESVLSSALSTAPPAGDLRPGFYARLAASSASARRPAWSGWIAAPVLAGVLLAALFAMHFHSSSRPAAIAVLPSQPPVPVADHHMTDPVSLWDALLPPTSVASHSERHAPGLRISAEVQHSPARISYRRPRRARLEYATRHSPSQMAWAIRSQHRRMRLTETIAMAQREARARKPMALASTQVDTGQYNAERAKLIPADDEVDFSVRDDVRGFTAGTHVSSLPATSNGDPVLIIEEKSDSPAEAGDGASTDF